MVFYDFFVGSVVWSVFVVIFFILVILIFIYLIKKRWV
jgi:hypothetical protein